MTIVKIQKKKGTKKCVIKIKIKFRDYKNCLEATQLDKKISHLEKNKIDVDSLKELIKSNKLKIKGMIFLLKKLIRLL